MRTPPLGGIGEGVGGGWRMRDDTHESITRVPRDDVFSAPKVGKRCLVGLPVPGSGQGALAG
jgi:hypothetical protein